MLNKISEIAREAGAIIMQQKNLTITSKEGHANFVTNIDVEVQEYLKMQLSKLIPEAFFIGEEQDNQALSENKCWVVDPIDGTMNFCRGWEFSAISIALLENKIPILACIYQPYKDEMFTAQKGEGAYLNHQRIFVSDIPLENALVGFGTSPYQRELAEKSMKLAYEFLKKTGDLRRTGSAALDLAYLACGRQDIFFELRLSPWDVAAGALLVEEAGGVFQMPLSEKIQFEKPAAVLVSNQVCAKKAGDLFMENVTG